MDLILENLKQLYQVNESIIESPEYRFLSKYFNQNVYVRFVDEGNQKLINRRNPGHGDPVGTYAFPISYVKEEYANESNFFFKSKNIQIIKDLTKGDKCILNEITSLKYAIQLLNEMNLDPIQAIKWAISDIEEEYELDEKLIDKENDYINPKVFFRATQLHKMSPGKQRANWVRIGFNAIEDKGDSIIHPDEPSQIVFLLESAYEVIDVYKSEVKNKQAHLMRKLLAKLFKDIFNEKIAKIDVNEKVTVSKAIGSNGHYISVIIDSNGYNVNMIGPNVQPFSGLLTIKNFNKSYNDVAKLAKEHFGIGKDYSSSPIRYSKQVDL